MKQRKTVWMETFRNKLNKNKPSSVCGEALKCLRRVRQFPPVASQQLLATVLQRGHPNVHRERRRRKAGREKVTTTLGRRVDNVGKEVDNVGQEVQGMRWSLL